MKPKIPAKKEAPVVRQTLPHSGPGKSAAAPATGTPANNTGRRVAAPAVYKPQQSKPSPSGAIVQQRPLNWPPVYRPQEAQPAQQKPSAHRAAPRSTPPPVYRPSVSRPPHMQMTMSRQALPPIQRQPRVAASHGAIKAQFSSPVIQCNPWRYKSQRDNNDYVVTQRSGSSKHYLYLSAFGGNDELGNMRYSFDTGTHTAYMEHVEAYGMPQGSRAGYLLFFRFVEHAAQQGMTTVAIGTGVTAQSANRNLQEATTPDAINEANRSLAAVAIYQALGFDATDAITLSNSTRTVQQVRQICVQKLSGSWLQWVPPAPSKCFLTTACVEWRGLPDDCLELTLLRWFRDNYVRNIPGGRSLIRRYYAMAPAMMIAINCRPDRERILSRIYRTVRHCVRAIQMENWEAALQEYQGMVLKLRKTLRRKN